MLSPAQHDISKAIPDNVCPTSLWWFNLEIWTDICRAMEERRTVRPPRREAKRWQRIETLANDLADEMRAVRLHRPAADAGDPLWPNRMLDALWPVKYRAESAQIAYEAMSHGYRGRSKPHRELFYRTICDLWIALGQELQTSTAPSGQAAGPLVRFFHACAYPAVGDIPVDTIASIIDRECKRRR